MVAGTGTEVASTAECAVPPGDPVVVVKGPSPVVASVVVVADDGSWSRDFIDYVSREGFDAVADPGGHSAFDGRLRTRDAVVIDLGLTARSGTAVCVAWRRRSDASILAVSSRGDEEMVLQAYAAGADNFASLDTSHRQLVARLRSLLRRNPPARASTDPTSTLPVLLGDDGHSAFVDGRQVTLTDLEYEVLNLLLSRPGAVVPRRELARLLALSSSSSRTVDFFVRRLRDKLEAVDTKRRIVAVRGVGFRFQVDLVDASGEPT